MRFKNLNMNVVIQKTIISVILVAGIWSIDIAYAINIVNHSNNREKFKLHLSLPHINSFRLLPKNESVKINTGFCGYTIGFDYFHVDNQFINFGVSLVMDFFSPLPAPFDRSGEWESMSSIYFSLSNNHRLGQYNRLRKTSQRHLIVGYGFSYAINTWGFYYDDRFDNNLPPPTREPVTKSHSALGLIFPIYYQNKSLCIGVVYRPTFYRPTLTDKFIYEHLISIDIGWKIRLNKKNSRI